MALVFAYGSNLDEEQMQRRCPTARFVGCATLDGYRFEFAGWSCGWQGAVANVRRDPDASVDGVVYGISPGDLLVLDCCEGTPLAYERLHRSVDLDGRGPTTVHVYVKPCPVHRGRLPTPAYVERVATGYATVDLDPAPLFEALNDLGALGS